MEYETYIHEIDNPLGVIFGVAQLLLTASPSEVKEYSKLIINSVKSIKAIKSDFASYRKTGKEKIKYEVVDVQAMLKDVVEEYSVIADEYGITLETDLNRARAFTDVSKLRQAISNVLSNGIKYNNRGGQVLIKCYTSGSSMHMVFEDNGIGMSKKELESIGTPFYRSKVVDRPGTGLGICTTIKLAKLLCWDLDIKSEVGSGSTFHFTLHHITG